MWRKCVESKDAESSFIGHKNQEDAVKGGWALSFRWRRPSKDGEEGSHPTKPTGFTVCIPQESIVFVICYLCLINLFLYILILKPGKAKIKVIVNLVSDDSFCVRQLSLL